jgi:hypothetical protein
MAAKKKPAAAPVDVPSVLLGEDGNKAVARAKASLAKKWSLTRAETLGDAVQLAWFSVALGRLDEARELAEHIAERVTFTGDYNVWTPVANAIALAARLARERNDEPRRASLIARLVEHPALAKMPREAFVKWVADSDKDIRSAEVEPSQKWALHGFARGCARATYFRETSKEGSYEPGCSTTPRSSTQSAKASPASALISGAESSGTSTRRRV